MKILKPLKSGDCVEIIAPASRCSNEALHALQMLLEGWGLVVKVAPDIFGNHPFCADEAIKRFKHFERALDDPLVKAIVGVRGGYGSMHLIPYLTQKAIIQPKWFLGMSDLTALHLFFQQALKLPTIHASLSVLHLDEESIAAVKALLFGETNTIQFTLFQPLNDAAKQLSEIRSTLIGGNLTLIQASIGTSWELQAKGKVVFLEEINERAYEVDRILTHLEQAHILDNVKAVIFGDFLKTNEPDGSPGDIDFVLNRFANSVSVPVIKISGVGHDSHNQPVLMGVDTRFIIDKATSTIRFNYV